MQSPEKPHKNEAMEILSLKGKSQRARRLRPVVSSAKPFKIADKSGKPFKIIVSDNILVSTLKKAIHPITFNIADIDLSMQRISGVLLRNVFSGLLFLGAKDFERSRTINMLKRWVA